MSAPPAPPAATVLVVEDEPRLAQLVADYLRADGLQAQVLHRGDQVLDRVRQQMPDLIVLDLMLPGLDGLGVCRALRAFSEVPVLMLTARVEEVDRLIGLQAGADDYVCKPFSPREVVARVRAILRRTQPRLAPAASAAEGAALPGQPAAPATALQIDDDGYDARLHGQPLGLTAVEFRLLKALVASAGRVQSRDQLLDCLHADARALSDRTVDSHVKNLRRKLQRVCPQAEAIRSIYGVGYRFDADALALPPG